MQSLELLEKSRRNLRIIENHQVFQIRDRRFGDVERPVHHPQWCALRRQTDQEFVVHQRLEAPAALAHGADAPPLETARQFGVRRLVFFALCQAILGADDADARQVLGHRLQDTLVREPCHASDHVDRVVALHIADNCVLDATAVEDDGYLAPASLMDTLALALRIVSLLVEVATSFRRHFCQESFAIYRPCHAPTHICPNNAKTEANARKLKVAI